jgi:hypothetical protein
LNADPPLLVLDHFTGYWWDPLSESSGIVPDDLSPTVPFSTWIVSCKKVLEPSDEHQLQNGERRFNRDIARVDGGGFGALAITIAEEASFGNTLQDDDRIARWIPAL